jgi:hypothetical protein
MITVFFVHFTHLVPEPPLAFSHSPGSMFLTDIPDTPLPTSQLSPCCFLISQDPLLYSLASEGAVGKIRQLEKVIGEDPGTVKHGNIYIHKLFFGMNFKMNEYYCSYFYLIYCICCFHLLA